MADLQDELDELTLENEDLREELRKKEEKIEELNDKLAQSEADQADKDRDADAAITLKRQFEGDLASRDQEILKLKTDLRTTQNENDNLKDKLQAAKSEAKKARAHDRKAGKEEKASRRDLIGTLAENAELQKAVAQNAETIEQLKNVLEDTVTKAETYVEDLNIKEGEVGEERAKVLDLQKDIAELERQLGSQDELIGELQRYKAAESDRMDRVRQDWAEDEVNLRRQAERANAALQEAQKQNMLLRDESRVGELDALAERLREELERVRGEYEESQEDVRMLYEQVRKLQDSNDALTNDFEGLKQDAIREEKIRADRAERKLERQVKATKEEQEKNAEKDEAVAKLQVELNEAEFWMDRYRRKYGLQDAVAYQRKLKEQLRLREKDIEELTDRMNERIEGYNTLYETCKRLKKMVGFFGGGES